MSEPIENFQFTNPAAEVDESISLEWQSKVVDSGSFTVELSEKLTDISAPAVKSL